MTILLIIFSLLGSLSFAHYTEGLWIPRHETLTSRSWRVDFQNLNSIDKEQIPNATDHQGSMGVSYGVYSGEIVAAEVGVDWKEPAVSQTVNALYFNFKISTNFYKEKGWGISLGTYDFGISGGETDFNMIYLLIQNGWGSNWSTTLGAYVGNSQLLLDAQGESDNKGLIAGVWRQMAKDFAAGAEFQSGSTQYGYLFAGFKWEVKNETHLNIGYGIAAGDFSKDWILARISLLL